jgi:integrase
MIDFLSSFPYAASTKRTYLNILTRFTVEVTNPQTITAGELLAWIDKAEWGSSRQCVALAATQKYLGWKYGQHPALSAKLKRVTGKPQRALEHDTALELLASFDPYTPKGARDLAICALALDTGLRVSELCRLQQADTDTDKRVLQVIVKGGQWEAAVFSEETAAHLERWKLFREKLNPKGYLFVNTYTGAGLKPNGLGNIVKHWGKRIGIKLSPHDLRRSFAVLATVNGAPERVLMAGGRWSSSQMVNRYTRTLKLEAMRRYLPMSKLK